MLKTFNTKMGAIDGQPREFTICDLCGVGILSEVYKDHPNGESCKRHQKTRKNREAAEKMAIAALSKVL